MDTIAQLLRWKADPGVAEPVYDFNALHIACHYGHEHAARLFVDAGVSINASTNTVRWLFGCHSQPIPY